MENEPLAICSKRSFDRKSASVKALILHSLYILKMLGIPLDGLSGRQREKMAMALLAVADVRNVKGWKKAKDANDTYAPTTREIIAFHNTNLEEHISMGSYDDIRRKDLKPLLLSGIVVQSKPDANNSNPTRGYKLSVEYSRIIRNYGQPDWDAQVAAFNSMRPTYAERLAVKRNIPKVVVHSLDGAEFTLRDGEHNALQKQIVEEFLPRFAHGAQLLYIGDSDNKYGIVFEEEKLTELGFSDLKQGILPDVVALLPSKGWIFMIEAYHTSNPITPVRRLELQALMGVAASRAVFVTAFANIASYHACPEELAWETEVWIATDKDHVIHRDGERFLGPYST